MLSQSARLNTHTHTHAQAHNNFPAADLDFGPSVPTEETEEVKSQH